MIKNSLYILVTSALFFSSQVFSQKNRIAYAGISERLIGLGLSYASYQSFWSIEDTSLSNQTKHPHLILKKPQVTLILEQRRLADYWGFLLNAREEFLFGLNGKATQDHLTKNQQKTINTKDFSFGTNLLAKVTYPVRIGATRSILSPTFATGLGFSYVKGIEGIFEENQIQIETLSYRTYQSGWKEYNLFIPLSIGLDFIFNKFTLSPDYRYRYRIPSEQPSDFLNSWEASLTLGYSR